MDNVSNGPVTPEEEAKGEALPTRDECNLAVLCQLLQFAGMICPFGNLLAPLILWLLKRKESAFLDEVGKEVVNFQISLIVYSFVCGLLLFVVIGFPLLAMLGIWALILIVLATKKASEGRVFRFPWIFRLIR
ncbi:DUF4870 domain-containing protein [uncultured Victivallis sp.]|uniref:DUF4870 domain-containing protein n=1 Tax=Victivallis sp. TaxID=2049020 RepID=UPI0025EB9506|nr:DUF4870 domain-containing protein [uncultured Victivallis sp.]